jgi:MFS transporter, CP family, cyanate transporter
MESSKAKALAGTPARILAYYAAGVLAAAQFSKLAVLAPALQAELGASLPLMATLIALLEVSGAVLGAWIGRLTARWELDRLLVGALVALAAAGAASATATSGWALLTWRLLESVGYLGIVVAAPTLIARVSTPDQRVAAMTLWSTFVPVGLALGAVLHSQWLQQHTWREVLLLSAIGPAALAAWLMVITNDATGHAPNSLAAPGSAKGAPRAAWYLALAFGGFTFFEMGLLALLPTLLSQHLGMPAPTAGAWTGWTTLATIVGSAAGGWWMARALGRATTLAVVSLMLPPFGFAAVIGWPEADGVAVVGLLVVINMLGGAFSSIAFSALPVVAQTQQRLPASYGALAQLGAAGSLLGPPALAGAVQVSGWPGAVLVALLASTFSAGLAVRALRPDRQP